MATYTDATTVRNRVENLDASITDAMIDAYIEEAETILNTVMGRSFISDFTAADHGILQAACNAWAAMNAITFNPAGFTDLSEATVILETLAFQWESILALLKEKTYVAYLESL